MKKPRLRVTKWLGDIPLEAECTTCPELRLKASGDGHRPDRTQYVGSLQRQFEAHVRLSHPEEERSKLIPRAGVRED